MLLANRNFRWFSTVQISERNYTIKFSKLCIIDRSESMVSYRKFQLWSNSLLIRVSRIYSDWPNVSLNIDLT